jgi:hypothetical protein
VEVLVSPRNGLANRLRALASAAVLADLVNAELRIAWLPCPAVPEPADALFLHGVPWSNASAADLESLPEVAVNTWVPRSRRETYTTTDVEATIVGNRFGEQWAIDRLLRDMSLGYRPESVVIVSGGNFVPRSLASGWRKARRRLYESLQWNSTMQSRQPTSDEAFLGLHFRFGDLSSLAPSPRVSAKNVLRALEGQPLPVVTFTDDPQAALPYLDELRHRGCTVDFSSAGSGPDVKELTSLQRAAVDWRHLGSALSVGYFAHSSFGEEAALLSGSGFPIPSSPRWRRGISLMQRMTG